MRKKWSLIIRKDYMIYILWYKAEICADTRTSHIIYVLFLSNYGYHIPRVGINLQQNCWHTFLLLISIGMHAEGCIENHAPLLSKIRNATTENRLGKVSKLKAE